METGTLTHTFQQLDTVLFPLILANMFHCCIPKIPNNKVYEYSYNVHCLIDTHLHLISTSLDILGLDILGANGDEQILLYVVSKCYIIITGLTISLVLSTFWEKV